MKRKFEHPEPRDGDLVGPHYWKSVGELTENPEFKEWLHREFPQGAAELEQGDRRQFLKIMAASFALAGFGFSGCRQPKKRILPYNKQPERIIPGVPIYYCTAMPGAREALPLIVETHDGRPTKIEGNPSYQGFSGGTDRFAQASILDMYDPDRMKVSTGENNQRLTREQVMDLLSTVSTRYGKLRGRGLAILANGSSSPTRARLQKVFQQQYPEAIWAEYEPLDFDNAEKAVEGFKRMAGRLRPVYRFDKAKRVLVFDFDFLNGGPGQLKWARDWATHRKVEGPEDAHKMNRVYAVESDFSLTGAMADHRLRASSSQMGALAAAFAAELLKAEGGSADTLKVLQAKAASLNVDPKWVAECVADLRQHKGSALVAAGPDQPVEVHALCAAMNLALGGVGETIDYYRLPENNSASIEELSQAIDREEVRTLIIMGGNPVYDAPADLEFGDKLDKVPDTIRYTYLPDETAVACTTVVAANHYLETWSDGLTFDGIYVPVQPMIAPLFEGFGETEFLARVIGENKVDEYEIVRETFAGISGSDSLMAFEQWLAEGVHEAALAKPEKQPFAAMGEQAAAALATDAVGKIKASGKLGRDALEVRFVASNQLYDGRYANNGWLLEMPDPMSKLTWDNGIHVSPKMGRELGILPDPGFLNEAGVLQNPMADFKQGKQESPLARLSVNGRTVVAPVMVMPGLADYTVVVSLGWGRKVAGRVGSGAGFNFYPLRESGHPGFVTGAKLEKTDGTYQLANTQEHWSMEGRAIVREANADYFAHNPDFANEMGMEAHSPPIYGPAKDMPLSEKSVTQPRGGSMFKTPAFGDPPHNYPAWQGEEAKEKFPVPQQWGMTIDLNSCTGCNACVIACQSENNIPIVGKDQVLRGREMHWIRLDRYFSSADGSTDVPEDPQVSFMGMACQHCEIAPCEYVCPFTATLHDEQGLNVMAYNRCAGTRYCANNCPYKVRRFNFFDWNKREIGEYYQGPLGTNHYKTEASQVERMQKNPDVTIRMRGVMEKCTYCVQRIQEANINQLRKAGASADVKVPDGTIRTACQQVCPTEAIDFGDISDQDTEVYKKKMNPRNYSVLGYLNVRPRTTYLARVRNANPKMPGAEAKGSLSRMEYKQASGASDHGKMGSDGSHGKKEHDAASSNGETHH